MSGTPEWLTPAAAPAPAAAPKMDTGVTSSQPAAVASPAAGEEGELPGVILTMRLANMGVSIALVIISILKMIGLPPISIFVLAFYATIGGILICCLETQLKFLRVMIAVNFGFLFSSLFRFLFYMLLAAVGWSYKNLLGKIVAIALIATAFFNTYVLCRYPSYRKIREKIAEEEDKRIETRISKEVKRQVTNQLRAQ